jgi:hypothetical protein
MIKKMTIKKGFIILVGIIVTAILLKKVMPALMLIFYMILLKLVNFNGEEITVTKDYVINPNWSETNNHISFSRMMLNDSCRTIGLKNPSEPELYYGLKSDPNYTYEASVKYNGEDYAERKVYFNRDNGFLWTKHRDGSDQKKIIGELQQDTWYQLSGLSPRPNIWYYIYLDSLDSLYVFTVSTMGNI